MNFRKNLILREDINKNKNKRYKKKFSRKVTRTILFYLFS